MVLVTTKLYKQGKPNGRCECMRCIETYLACGPTNQSSKDFEDSCVQLKSCLHIQRMLLYGIGGPIFNGTRLPVDQILLLGCWYLPITSSC